jgi:hypothetical protein
MEDNGDADTRRADLIELAGLTLKGSCQAQLDTVGEFRIGEFLQHCGHKKMGQFYKLSH